MTRALLAAIAIAVPLEAQTPRQFDSLPASYRLDVALVIAHRLIGELDGLADTAKIEHVRCGLGIVTGPSAWVDLLHAPRVVHATDSTVVAGPCPLAVVVEWHNHIPSAAEIPDRLCYFGTLDLGALHRSRAAFFMVHVRRGIYCWWTRSQVEDQVRRTGFSQPLLPVRGQTSW